MTTRPRLTRSIPFWGLIAGSVASTAFGVWLVVDKIAVMEAGLLDGSATGVEVYGGQSWVILGGAFVAAGLVGLVVSLALAAARSLLPQPPVEVVEPIDWAAESDAPVESDAPAPAESDRLGYDADLAYDEAEAAQEQRESESAPAR